MSPPSLKFKQNRPLGARSERGLALMLVIFMVALASTVLIALTDSTYVAMRLNSAAERRVRAEYILKSAVNVAQALIRSDITDFDDPVNDAWMQFSEGQEVPGALIGIQEQNVRVSLLISSEEGKIPVRAIMSASGTPDMRWLETVTRLFELLGFDAPDPVPAGQNPAPQASPDSKQMVVNLFDYLDRDKENGNLPNYPAGIEATLPPEREFRNDQNLDSLAGELGAIPGFTPRRVQLLLPFISNWSHTKININAAPREVIQALSPDIDATQADAVVNFRQPGGGGPFTGNDRQNQLTTLLGPDTYSQINSRVAVKGSFYNIIAKVEYASGTFMASAVLRADQVGRLPRILDFQIY